MTCNRCKKATIGTIMSMFNEEMICEDCKDYERTRPGYKTAWIKDMTEYAGRLDALGMVPQAENVRNLAKSLESE
jgi:hypothetical protein